MSQLNDHETIFQNFRDVNMIVEDMLEMKKNYTSTEAELKEMHTRYCYLSIQFAELEEKRQKLIFALKNQKLKMK